MKFEGLEPGASTVILFVVHGCYMSTGQWTSDDDGAGLGRLVEPAAATPEWTPGDAPASLSSQTYETMVQPLVEAELAALESTKLT